MSQPGLPSLPSDADFPDAPDAMDSDDDSLPQGDTRPQWGLYQDGEPIIVSDSVVTFGFKAVSQISTYPVENGGFQSYDKVQLPNNGRLRYSTGGTLADRTAFLASVEAAKRTTDLYDCVTPEITLPNMNVTDYDYDRSNDSAGLLVIDVMIEEVVPTATATFSTTPGVTPITNAKAPGANDPRNDGLVQAGPVAAATSATLAAASVGAAGGT